MRILSLMLMIVMLFGSADAGGGDSIEEQLAQCIDACFTGCENASDYVPDRFERRIFLNQCRSNCIFTCHMAIVPGAE